jgi:hypothetical protein
MFPTTVREKRSGIQEQFWYWWAKAFSLALSKSEAVLVGHPNLISVLPDRMLSNFTRHSPGVEIPRATFP